MSKILYNFLADSIILNESSYINNYKNESSKRLLAELEAYRHHVLSNIEIIQKEINSQASLLKVFAPIKRSPPLTLLMQTALYLDQFIINDPLFQLTPESNPFAISANKLLGFPDREFNKMELANVAKFLKDITPMVAGGYLKLFPTSYYFEGPKDIPLRLPIDYDSKILPSEILSYFQDNAVVSAMKKDNDGYIIDEGKLYPTRSIVVDFKGANFENSKLYFLQESSFHNHEGKTTIKMYLPDTVPNPKMFEAWVAQSINTTAKHFYDKVSFENYIASSLNSTYLCDNQFTSDLLNRHFGAKETIASYTANEWINLELPFLQNIDVNALMDIRNFEADVFTTFRLELEKQFRELRVIQDPNVLRLKRENILHELNNVQYQKVRRTIEDLPRKMAINATIALGGLAASATTSGYSLLASFTALAKGYKDYNDYKEKVKENPAYFLWKVRKKKP